MTKEIREYYDKRVAELAEHGLTPTDVDDDLAMIGELLAQLAEEKYGESRADQEMRLEHFAKLTEKLEAQLVYIYNMGYGQGHDDTVESCYTDVMPVDAHTYHADIVADILADQQALENDDDFSSKI